MIREVKITNHLGEVLVLEMQRPEQSGFYIKGIEGLGPSKSVINTTEAPNLDGSFYNSSRVSSRNLVFKLGFMDMFDPSIETIRQQTYRFFPLKKVINIEVTTDNRVGVTSGFVESNEPMIFSREETAIISLICPSAFFYGSEFIDTVFTGIEGGFEFPFSNESTTLALLEFGSIFTETERSVFYTGDEPTGIIIYVNFTGSVNDLTIHNATLGQMMPIVSSKVIAQTGSDFINGDQLIISTIKGEKSITLIRGGVEHNLLNALGANATWFFIERGDNVFTYTADSGLSNMQFLIEHRLVYQGL